MRLIDADALKGLLIDTLESIKKNPKMDRQETHIIAACHMLGEMIDDAPTVSTARSGWISVEDRLPEKNQAVLGWYKDNPFAGYTYGVVSWNGKGWVFVYAQRYVTNVTHWMPLPEMPETLIKEGVQ